MTEEEKQQQQQQQGRRDSLLGSGKLLERRKSLDPAKIDTFVVVNRDGEVEEEEEEEEGREEQIQLGSNLAKLVLLQDRHSSGHPRRSSVSNVGANRPDSSASFASSSSTVTEGSSVRTEDSGIDSSSASFKAPTAPGEQSKY